VSQHKLKEEWTSFKKDMSSNGVTVEMLVNQHTFASMLIDTGNLVYSLINPHLVKRAGLQCLSTSPWVLVLVSENMMIMVMQLDD
jgi:hypothetical protein